MRGTLRIVSLGVAAGMLAACGDGGEGTSPAPTAAPTAAPPAATSDEGCSPDNSPTPLSPAAGPVPEIAVRPESEANDIPDLAVRRINCAGGWVNLKNEIPADRPVLVWFWAPY